MIKLTVLGLAACCLVAAAPDGAIAQTRSPEAIMKNLDKDGDDRISAAEAEGSPMQFERLDADSDGYVTLTELTSGGRSGGRSPSGGTQGSNPEAILKAQDLNKDHRIALREWMNHQERRFLTIDVDGDGYLTVEELSSEE
jgi:hypothetical protein